jgi:hypothetical protein
MVKCGVLFEVRPGVLNIIYANICFENWSYECIPSLYVLLVVFNADFSILRF